MLGVYFVTPASMAFIAASFTFCGVSKSGSPTLKSITSFPSAFNCFVLDDTASVGEGLVLRRVRLRSRETARCLRTLEPRRRFERERSSLMATMRHDGIADESAVSAPPPDSLEARGSIRP